MGRGFTAPHLATLISMRTRALVTALFAAILLTACAPSNDLLFLCSNEESVCEQWRADFEHDSGIPTRFLRLPTSEALARITSERGKPEFDAWVGGPSESYVLADKRGLLEPYRPKYFDSIPNQFKDEHAAWFGVYGSVLGFCINPHVLAENNLPHPTGWKDLEDPRLKTWISASSPLTSGTAFTALWTQTQLFDNPEEHLEKVYDNVGRFTHSGTAPASAVAAGDAGVAITFTPYCEQDFDPNVDLEVVFPNEGTFYEVGAAALLVGSRSESEARVFLDWLSSARGQQAMGRAGIPQSPINADLPDNLQEFLASTNVKVLDATAPELAEQRDAWLQWSFEYLEFSK